IVTAATPPESPEKTAPAVEAPAAAAAPATGAGEVRASPLARRLARERGIDLSTITGSGPGGRIVESDIPEQAAPAPAAAVAPAPVGTAAPAPMTSENVELSRMRQAIARVTVDSKREAPHFYVTIEVDMTKAMSFRRDINDELDAEKRVSVNDLIVKASAIAIGRHPKFNSFFRDDHLQMNASINVGIAIALESGLIVPGINACESKSLVEIATASRDLVSRANSGTLRNEEYSGTTFSVSNLGMFDVDSFTAIIFPPHAAVLAVGKVKEQPVVRDGDLAVAQIMKATLSTDHRVADGAEAAQFLVEIKKLLENPVSLVI
ncbi:MAG: 2-oxo acid dehydrogenase subunit E2, partial [Chloroflexi bacterium]|nr:2-oxo acid dehydrogenase subunit E2 [Chloroflexota bacterium]